MISVSSVNIEIFAADTVSHPPEERPHKAGRAAAMGYIVSRMQSHLLFRQPQLKNYGATIMELKVTEAICNAIAQQDLTTATALLNLETGGSPTLEMRFTDRSMMGSMMIVELTTPQSGIVWLSRANLSGPQYEKRAPQVAVLVQAYLRQSEIALGCVAVHIGDRAASPGLGFCSSTTDVTLVPDAVFIRTLGYQSTRTEFKAIAPPWDQRQPIAFWRGSASGPHKTLMKLPRVALYQIVAGNPLFDVGLTLIPPPRRVD